MTVNREQLSLTECLDNLNWASEDWLKKPPDLAYSAKLDVTEFDSMNLDEKEVV